MPCHESEALEDKQNLQTKTFSELAECLARIPPRITLYRLLFKYDYVGCLLLLMFSNDLLFQEPIKRVAYIFKEIACVASVSNRVIARKLERKKVEEGGGGEKRKRLPANPTILKNAP